MKIFTPCIIRETASGLNRVPIEDEMMRSREIFLTGEVDAESMGSLLKQLMFLNHESPDEEITLYINSPGGEVDSGFAVYDYIKVMPAPLRTVCVGLAASMGAILFLAAQKREMFPHSKIMIHDPAPGGGSLAGMKPAQLEDYLSSLKKVQKVLGDTIASATGQTRKWVLTKTKKDTYFDADEALKYGLATKIITEKEPIR